MPVGEVCNREVVIASRTTRVVEAAQRMRQHHVGDVVVVDEEGGVRKPVGIVTDRDLVVEVIAKTLSFQECTLDAIMNTSLVCVPETEGLIETIRLMRAHSVRRLPVVDGNGALVGIVTADDLLDLLAGELTELARIAPRQQAREVRTKLPSCG